MIEKSELLRIRLCDRTDRSPLTASFGIAEAVVEMRTIEDDISDLLSRADKAMYQAKRLGGDRVAHHVNESLSIRAVDERQ